jgi:hypothetical protein
LNIAGGEPFSVEASNLVLEFVRAGLILVEEHRLVVAIAVAWHLNGHITCGSAKIACAFAVAGVARVATAGSVGFIAKLLGEFGLHHVFECTGEEACKNAFFAEEIVDAFSGGQFLLNPRNVSSTLRQLRVEFREYQRVCSSPGRSAPQGD